MIDTKALWHIFLITAPIHCILNEGALIVVSPILDCLSALGPINLNILVGQSIEAHPDHERQGRAKYKYQRVCRRIGQPRLSEIVLELRLEEKGAVRVISNAMQARKPNFSYLLGWGSSAALVRLMQVSGVLQRESQRGRMVV